MIRRALVRVMDGSGTLMATGELYLRGGTESEAHERAVAETRQTYIWPEDVPGKSIEVELSDLGEHPDLPYGMDVIDVTGA